jgi:BirA family biotin operon repressor/biotin-[acetyl-CoA-carboxylase] ligase
MSAALQEAPRREQLLSLLADGELHSGERLAAALQVTRAAVWKLIHALRDLGIEIDAQPKGYRLLQAVSLYDAQRLRALCGAQADCLQQVEVLFAVDSTNRHVNQQPVTTSGKAVLCVAELQQAGRGRRGRSWLAPFGESICMSLGWLFESMPPNFSSLSLVVGVALIRVLRKQGAAEVGVKWPNDLLWRGNKLAGVLIEMRGEPDGPAQVVIGIGLNTCLSATSREQLAAQQLSVCDLHEILGEHLDRNALVAAFTCELLTCLQRFAQDGFAPFMAEWQSYDLLYKAEVQVLQGEQRLLGIAQGVSLDGSLLLYTPDGVRSFISGEVSLRARDN